MAKYSVIGNRTGSSSLGVWTVAADTVTPRRLKVYDWLFGSEGAVADNPFLWRVARVTAAGSLAGTTVTPAPLDSADAAALADAMENLTTNPTIGSALLEQALNQRASYRWVANPGSELISPATGDNGFIAQTPTTAAVAITSTVLFSEE